MQMLRDDLDLQKAYARYVQNFDDFTSWLAKKLGVASKDQLVVTCGATGALDGGLTILLFVVLEHVIESRNTAQITEVLYCAFDGWVVIEECADDAHRARVIGFHVQNHSFADHLLFLVRERTRSGIALRSPIIVGAA